MADTGVDMNEHSEALLAGATESLSHLDEQTEAPAARSIVQLVVLTLQAALDEGVRSMIRSVGGRATDRNHFPIFAARLHNAMGEVSLLRRTGSNRGDGSLAPLGATQVAAIEFMQPYYMAEMGVVPSAEQSPLYELSWHVERARREPGVADVARTDDGRVLLRTPADEFEVAASMLATLIETVEVTLGRLPGA